MALRCSFVSCLLLLSVFSFQHSLVLSQELELRETLHRSHNFLARDGHGHHHSHVQPILELNETEVLMNHAPTPPSYYTIDWEEPQNADKRHPGLIISHAIFMSLAFFIALPMGIILRSVKHTGQTVAVMTFYGLSILGCASSGLYTKLTPNMYEGSAHGKHGYVVLTLAVLLSAIDILAGIRRFLSFVRSNQTKSFKLSWNRLVSKKDANSLGTAAGEYAHLAMEEPEEVELPQISRESSDGGPLRGTSRWTNDVHNHLRGLPLASSTHSDIAFDGKRLRPGAESRNLVHRIGSGVPTVLERFLVVAGFAQLVTGTVIYTGGCRGNYLYGCREHLIKGGIYWLYGLLTFARFLGSFADLGWAWNKAPIGDPISAEFAESFLNFFYGTTDIWVKYLDSKPGDPVTTKKIQHINITVMFWFAGMIGMAIESKRVRKWVSASISNTIENSANAPQDAITEPPSYSFSFNPFPALVTGVTGASMSVHLQTYLFQAQIHALWGNLLVGFSVLRCLTYFFLWLSPPRSILPSRPPTEVLGSFFMACGGLILMLSNVEISYAAMRRGRDDVMIFLTAGVAVTCFAFCWVFFLVAFKGWLKSRQYTGVTYKTPA